MRDQPRILVVDDDPAIIALVEDFLTSFGYQVDTAGNGVEACAKLRDHSYELVLTDMIMPEMGGMELVQHLQLHHPETLSIVFTGFASYQDAVTATKLGAFDYLTKPLQLEILRHAIDRALEYQRLYRAQKDLEIVFQGAEALGWQAVELISDSPEAEILRSLRNMSWDPQKDLKEIGQCFLEAAHSLVKSAQSSIFLFDAANDRFRELAVLGPQAEARAGATASGAEGIMGYVAAHRRPLLISDLTRDTRFQVLRRRSYYQTPSFMIIPLTGTKLWGVINLADRQDKQPFSPRDLFLAWLLARIFVEVLESRQAPEAVTPPWTHDEIPLGLGVLDQDLQVVHCNPALERLINRPENTTPRELFPYLGLTLQDQHKLEEAFRRVLLHQEHQELALLKTLPQNNAVKFLRIKMIPWPGDREATQGLLLVEDVSELELLKQRLNLYEQLAIMGKLTLFVVHELNNPLDGIRRYLSLALLKKDDPGEVERYLTEAQKGLQRMALSLQSLMFSVNPYKAPPRPTDNIFNLLQDAIKIMMFQASDQRVQVSSHCPPELQKMMVEADLYYVFINVIKNALQAMPQGGHLRIDGYLHDSKVEISFQDSGPGLSPQEIQQVFQPFYSTKAAGHGLGLGLPICRKILERYHGTLEVESQPGQGAKVKVILPHLQARTECPVKIS